MNLGAADATAGADTQSLYYETVCRNEAGQRNGFRQASRVAWVVSPMLTNKATFRSNVSENFTHDMRDRKEN
jgi:hypothetical protein